MLSEYPPMAGLAPSFIADDAADWFARELRPHEPMLRKYLAGRFPDLTDADDIVQEAYLRLLKVRCRRPIRVPRAMLLATARNLALDALRRRRVRPFADVSPELACAIADETQDVPRAVMRRDELSALAAAVASLPPRCRETMTLRLQGLPHKEVAARLGISWSTVEKHVTAAIKTCAACLRERRVLPEAAS